MTGALMRFRKGGFLQLDTDYEDEPNPYRRFSERKFYAM